MVFNSAFKVLKNISLCNKTGISFNIRSRIIIVYSIFGVLISFFEEKFEKFIYVYERNIMYFCFKINCSPHDFFIEQSLKYCSFTYQNTNYFKFSHQYTCGQ